MRKGLSAEKKQAIRGALLAYMARTKKKTPEVATVLGVTQQNVSKARDGGAGADFLERLNEHLRTSTDALLEQLRRGDYAKLFEEDDARRERERKKKAGTTLGVEPTGGISAPLRKKIEAHARRRKMPQEVVDQACASKAVMGVLALTDQEIERYLDLWTNHEQVLGMFFKTVSGSETAPHLADFTERKPKGR